MIISIHQPDFMPWIGYFDKIKESNVHIFLDDVQFSRRGWTHRDKIFSVSENMAKWITVPIKKKSKYDQKIKDVIIDNSVDWKKKHLGQIKTNYNKSKNFNIVFSKINFIYSKNHNYLIDLNIEIINSFCEFLKIKRKMEFSSNMSLNSSASDRIIEILKKKSCKNYITGLPSKNYLEMSNFKKNNIEINWHILNDSIYKKNYKNFDKNLSAIDYLMNTNEKF
tara:strand:+ start:178 stop:846 length:669 start_codon:yes stop_codon:yes gene_type:complete